MKSKTQPIVVILLLLARLALQVKVAKHNIWLDCDPGLDDTIAIILAARDPRINLLGVSTSPGNTCLQNTTRNALDILHNCQRDDVQVVEGSNQLIKGEMVLGQMIHGSNGLGNVEIQKSPNKAIKQNNFQTIRNIIMNSEDQVIWANTGSMTNLYILLSRYPQVKSKIKQIVAMGGAIGTGNMSPAAQFNIFFDPNAAKGVFDIKGEVPLVLIPLELTHKVQAYQSVLNKLQQYNHPFFQAIANMLKFFQKMYKIEEGFDYPPVHDPCVIYFILQPEQFQLKNAKIQVDTYPTSYGRTNCYIQNQLNPSKKINSIDQIALSIKNVQKFWQLNFKHYQQIMNTVKQL